MQLRPKEMTKASSLYTFGPKKKKSINFGGIDRIKNTYDRELQSVRNSGWGSHQ